MKKYRQLDAGSMYPKLFISFCLSPENYIDQSEMPSYFPDKFTIQKDIDVGYKHWSKTEWGKYCVENNIIPIPVQYRQEIEELKKVKDYKGCNFDDVTKLRGIYYFKQNPNAIQVKAFQEPMIWKADLKKQLKENHTDLLQQSYDASKRFNNTGFGGSGNIFNILFKLEVFNTDTFLARDLMHYVKEKAEQRGYELIFIDTDSFVMYADEDIEKLLNMWAIEWAMNKYGNSRFDLEFENEGYYKSLYVGGNCRYMGYLIKPNGEEEKKIRGLQIKRKSSTNFQKEEQEKFLDWLLEGHTYEEIKDYISNWVKRIYDRDICDLAIPCKFSKPREKYGKKEEFFKAYDATRKINPEFDKKIDQPFYYIQVKNSPYFIAFDKNDMDLIKKYELDYQLLIEKQIFKILIPTFAGLNMGRELLDLCEENGIVLDSTNRNKLLCEYDNYDELKKYYSAKESKKRISIDKDN